MGWIFKPFRSRPRSFQRARKFRQTPLATRQTKKHGRLGLGIRRDVIRPFDLLTWRRNVLCFIKAPCQHDRQNFACVEQRLLLRPAFGKSVGQVNELDEKASIGLRRNGGGVTDFHSNTSLQFDARLPMNGSEQTGSDVSRAMDRYRHSLATFGHDVVTAVNAVKLPAFGFEPRNDFLARHGSQ